MYDCAETHASKAAGVVQPQVLIFGFALLDSKLDAAILRPSHLVMASVGWVLFAETDN